MARNGLSLTVIATKLNVDQVPLLGRTAIQGVPVVWSAALVHKLLTGRAAIGEYQPHRERKPVGKPVLNYYPSVVDPVTFAAVQASLHSRAAVGRGRRGKKVNLFAGLMYDSRSGGKLMARHHTETETVKRESVIIPANAVHGRGGKWSSYPLAAFEKALLSKLIEVKIEDVQGKEPVGNALDLLKGRLEEIETLTKKWKAKMDRPELIDAVAEKLVGLETERRNLNGQIEAAERDSATTLSEALSNLQTVGKIIDDDSGDESRLRCRSAIRRTVESIWCLFMPGRGTRIAAVQVWFRGGAHRDYLISCRPGMANANFRRPVEWSVRSFVSAMLPAMDLRDPRHASRLEKSLMSAANEKV